MFCRFDGRVIDRVHAYGIVKALARRAGVKASARGAVGTHSMRKTFAAAVFDSFARTRPEDALRFTQKALGHASIASTEHYLPKAVGEVEDGIVNVQNDFF